MKPGYQTTEFWVTVLGGTLAATLPDFPIEAAAAVIVYVISRSWVKSTAK